MKRDATRKGVSKKKVGAKKAGPTSFKPGESGNPDGPQSKYDAATHPELARKVALLGAKDHQIAEVLGVCEATLNNWKLQHPAFKKALDSGKLEADAEIAHSLYHRARGYSHPAVKILQYEGVPLTVEYTEHYPPDTPAASLWLRNRQSKLWRDKVEHVGGSPDDPPIAHAHKVTVALDFDAVQKEREKLAKRRS